MKRISWKIPGMIALILTAWSIALLIASHIVSIGYEYSGEGLGLPFKVWINSILAAGLSMVFYVIDAVKSIIVAITAIRGEKRLFHFLLAVLLLGGIPMLYFVGGSPEILFSVLWNVYYLAMAALEAISIWICWRKGILVRPRYVSKDAHYTESCKRDQDIITPHVM